MASTVRVDSSAWPGEFELSGGWSQDSPGMSQQNRSPRCAPKTLRCVVEELLTPREDFGLIRRDRSERSRLNESVDQCRVWTTNLSVPRVVAGEVAITRPPAL